MRAYDQIFIFVYNSFINFPKFLIKSHKFLVSFKLWIFPKFPRWSSHGRFLTGNVPPLCNPTDVSCSLLTMSVLYMHVSLLAVLFKLLHVLAHISSSLSLSLSNPSHLQGAWSASRRPSSPSWSLDPTEGWDGPKSRQPYSMAAWIIRVVNTAQYYTAALRWMFS